MTGNCDSRILLVLAAVLVTSGPVSLQAQAQDSAQEALADSVAADTVSSSIDRAREILIELDAAVDTILVLDFRRRGLDEEELELLRVSAIRIVEQVNEVQGELLELIPELEEADVPLDSIREAYGAFLSTWVNLYDQAIDRYVDRIDELRDQRSSTPPDQLDDLETSIQEAKSRLDDILERQVSNFSAAGSVGFDTSEEWETLEHFAVGRAESLVGRLQIAADTRERLQSQIGDAERAGAPASEIAALRTRFRANERRVAGVAESLNASADILEGRGFETDQYRQFVIRATGEVTGDVLDPGVAFGLLGDLWEAVWGWFRDNAPTLLVRLLIIIGIVALFRVGFRLGWWIYRTLGLLKHSRLFTDLVQRMLRPVATILGLVTGFAMIGVDPATLLAGLGVAGIIVGLALQDSLANLAAGFFILATRPYDVDDVIEGAGVLGTVKAMGLANTTVVTFDNRRLLVPNRKIWGEVIENRSAERVRRVDATVRISYREDLDRAMGILGDLLKENERVLDTPEPAIFVSELADSWIELAVRPWVKNEDWWPLLTELPRLVRLRFEEVGIEVPYPRREIVEPRESEPGEEQER
jgi:small conductance mechanosensitive channel